MRACPLHALILHCNTKFARERQRVGFFPAYKFNRLPVYRLQPSITKEISFFPAIFSSIYSRNENNFTPFFFPSYHVNNSGLIFLVISFEILFDCRSKDLLWRRFNLFYILPILLSLQRKFFAEI